MGAHKYAGDVHCDEPDAFPVSGAIVRPALSAGLSFMEMSIAPSLRLVDLVAWIGAHLVEPGFMPMPSTVHEPEIGSVSVTAQPAEAWTASMDGRATRIVHVARERVAAALQGLVAVPVNDRFLNANIFAGRVHRATTDRGIGWQPRLTGQERLADIVLALFAADVLGHREDYERGLAICEDCGRMCFGPTAAMGTHCKRRR